MSDLKQVWSCGGGTQSCAIGALIVQGKLPKPDIAAIADTGKEMPTTWTYFNSVLKPELAKVGVDIVRVKKDQWACNWGREIFATSGQLMIPAFSDYNGNPAKLSAFCSGAWKQEVVDRWLSNVHNLTRKNYRKWIGFSYDETTRILRMQKGEEFKNGLIWFPLLNGYPLKRHDAIKVVTNMGWPEPSRSRCWMCPNQSDKEWYEVKTNHPKLFKKAIQMDEDIRKIDAHAFLHSSIAPLKDADLEPQDDLFSGGCHSGECFL